ncbi:hypothetical protein FE782_21875 [Paenibacillus antri]|uniref:DUF2933 domain-containing protein n=1 Tax=Paenibacillus antri TaxID=2582848 RepID=A0A5R9G2E1_9BACL|nr:hypothetical protein [Paenibacillus antri]TLS49991.1 hypothetical protein FE782_21875 [Paenibacillus antri]
MEWSYLALLLCPLMMLPMVFLMLRGNKSDSNSKQDHESHLIEQLAELKRQNEVMQKELREMKGNEV